MLTSAVRSPSPSLFSLPGCHFVRRAERRSAMATATKKARSGGPVARPDPIVRVGSQTRASAPIEFLIFEDNGGAYHEELDLDVGADVVVGDEREHVAAGEPLDRGDELVSAWRSGRRCGSPARSSSVAARSSSSRRRCRRRRARRRADRRRAAGSWRSRARGGGSARAARPSRRSRRRAARRRSAEHSGPTWRPSLSSSGSGFAREAKGEDPTSDLSPA